MAYLTAEKQEKIDKRVEAIRLETGLSYPENNLLDIANALGVKVISADLPDFNGQKVKGYIQWNVDGDGNHHAEIYLNSSQFDTTKTFTLAHELGHFLLHKDEKNFRIDLLNYLEDDPKNQETEANYFAGSLLVPKDKLLKALNEEGGNIEEVAKLFNVSVPVIENRLKWLHLKVG